MWLEVLREYGTGARLTDAGRRLTLCRGAEVVSWRLRRFKRAPRPSEITSANAGQALWLPDLTRAVRERLNRLDIAWVSDSGDLHLRTPWGLISYDSAEHSHGHQKDAEPAVRLSLGTLAVLQFLLEHPGPASQQRIAAAVDLSQPRVSQVLRKLREDEVVERIAGGWRVPDPERALGIWLRAAVPPATLTTTWYGLAPAREQIATIWRQAEAERAEIRLCGDWAADLTVPWRRPGLITAHVDQTLDLGSQGFVPAAAETATVALHVGPVLADWRPDAEVIDAMTQAEILWPVAPVTEIVREIRATGGSDAAQAVDELTSAWLRARAVIAAERGR